MLAFVLRVYLAQGGAPDESVNVCEGVYARVFEEAQLAPSLSSLRWTSRCRCDQASACVCLCLLVCVCVSVQRSGPPCPALPAQWRAKDARLVLGICMCSGLSECQWRPHCLVLGPGPVLLTHGAGAAAGAAGCHRPSRPAVRQLASQAGHLRLSHPGAHAAVACDFLWARVCVRLSSGVCGAKHFLVAGAF